MSIDERIAIARAPITVGILGTLFSAHAPSLAHAGHGRHPSTPVFSREGRAVGTRAHVRQGSDWGGE